MVLPGQAWSAPTGSCRASGGRVATGVDTGGASTCHHQISSQNGFSLQNVMAPVLFTLMRNKCVDCSLYILYIVFREDNKRKGLLSLLRRIYARTLYIVSK